MSSSITWSATDFEAELPPASGRRAVFFDRDGVVNAPFEYAAWGFDSPASAEHLSLYTDAARAIEQVRSAGFLALLASNQPGVAKGKYSLRTFKAIDRRLSTLLTEGGARLDGRYYCLHHPAASVRAYRVACDCRKPKPGLLRAAAGEWGLDLARCYFIGDSERDVLAAQAAGCHPILLQREAGSVADWQRRLPRATVVSDLDHAVDFIREGGITDVA